VAAAGNVMFIVELEADSRRVDAEDAAIVTIENRAEDVGVVANVAIDATAIEAVGAIIVEPAS
jgi:hypothetical protein